MSHTIKVLLTQEEIKQTVSELAQRIANDFRDQEVVLVGVLDGAYAILHDLAVALHEVGMSKLVVDFVGIDTYGSSTTSSKKAKITKDLKHDIRDKVVILVEDIVDTGYSLSILQSLLKAKLPKKIVTAALLSKDERREIDVPVEYIGKHIPNEFVVGYGLDYDGKYYRELPYIGVVKFD